jgi:hypothetical protein
MSKVKIQGHASGSGVLTVTAPNTSTDRTITLPDTTGTLLDENSSVPAANLTGTVADARISALTASKLTGALPAISAANLTAIPAANLTGTLPAISGANLTGISGGLSEADHWRLTASFNSPNDGVSFITTNWERPDTYGGGGYVGTGMSEAAGVWTFPSTGIWLVTFNVRASSPADARYITGRINTTLNNSSYSIAAIGYGSLNPVSSYWYTNIRTTFMFDVTNVSTHKVKFSAGGIVNDVGITGDTNQNETYVTFLKLGET